MAMLEGKLSVDTLTSDENNFVNFKISSCTEEDFQEQRDISSNSYILRGGKPYSDENSLDCASNSLIVHQMKLYIS